MLPFFFHLPFLPVQKTESSKNLKIGNQIFIRKVVVGVLFDGCPLISSQSPTNKPVQNGLRKNVTVSC